MATNRETWNAGQIGASFGAYSGKRVRFMFDHALVDGILTRSDGSMNTNDSGRVMLVVDGTSFMVDNVTLVEVL